MRIIKFAAVLLSLAAAQVSFGQGLQGSIPYQTICVGTPNATGVPSVLEATGSPVAADDNVLLRVTGLPANNVGIFFTGREAAITPIMSGNGFVCISVNGNGGIGRFNAVNQIVVSDGLGVATFDTALGRWSVNSLPTTFGSYPATVGTTTYFQYWHRDHINTGTNFSSAIAITWQ